MEKMTRVVKVLDEVEMEVRFSRKMGESLAEQQQLEQEIINEMKGIRDTDLDECYALSTKVKC